MIFYSGIKSKCELAQNSNLKITKWNIDDAVL